MDARVASVSVRGRVTMSRITEDEDVSSLDGILLRHALIHIPRVHPFHLDLDRAIPDRLMYHIDDLGALRREALQAGILFPEVADEDPLVPRPDEPHDGHHAVEVVGLDDGVETRVALLRDEVANIGIEEHVAGDAAVRLGEVLKIEDPRDLAACAVGAEHVLRAYLEVVL